MDILLIYLSNFIKVAIDTSWENRKCYVHIYAEW